MHDLIMILVLPLAQTFLVAMTCRALATNDVDACQTSQDCQQSLFIKYVQRVRRKGLSILIGC